MDEHKLQAAFALAFVAASLYLAQPSLAIGISPGRIEMDFSPGKNMTYDVYIIGGSYSSIAVSSKPTGGCGLSEYIVPERTEFSLDPGEKAYFTVTVSLPAEYPRPGLHDCGIVAEETPQEGYSGISAFSAVQMQVWIRVPYPERYLEGKLSVQNVNLSDTAHFTLNLGSVGLKDVTASAMITVKDSDGRVVATIRTESVFIKSMENGVIEASWDTTGMPAGRYYAEALVDYGAERPLTIGSEFKIGDILVKIINVTYPSDIFPDGIVRLDVLVDSFWNDRIEGAYITLDVTKGGLSVGQTRRSESFDLAPWESRLVPVYWDTSALSEGSYDAVFSVHYAGREERGAVALEIKQRQNPYLWLLIAILAIAAAVAYLVLRKKHRKKGGAPHGG
jgi:hypothetical protein